MHEKLQLHWEVMQRRLDLAQKEHFEEQANTRIKVQSYLLRRRAELAMWLGDDLLDELTAAKGCYAKCPKAVEEARKRSVCAKSMFSVAWLGCSRELFLESMRTALAKLESDDFAKDADVLFRTFMKQQCQRLRDEGHMRGSSIWAGALILLGHEVSFGFDIAGDQLGI